MTSITTLAPIPSECYHSVTLTSAVESSDVSSFKSEKEEEFFVDVSFVASLIHDGVSAITRWNYKRTQVHQSRKTKAKRFILGSMLVTQRVGLTPLMQFLSETR